MSDQNRKVEATIERIVIFAKLSDGSVKEIFIPDKDQEPIIKKLMKTYGPLRIVDTDLSPLFNF